MKIIFFNCPVYFIRNSVNNAGTPKNGGKKKMSPKELLYIEDTLGHEKQIKTTCQESARQLEDDSLKQFVETVGKKHSDCFTKFYGLLG